MPRVQAHRRKGHEFMKTRSQERGDDLAQRPLIKWAFKTGSFETRKDVSGCVPDVEKELTAFGFYDTRNLPFFPRLSEAQNGFLKMQK